MSRKNNRFKEHREALKTVFRNRNEKIKELEAKHPHTVMFINLISVLLLFALAVSCIGWKVQINNERKIEEAAAIAWAEQKAAEETNERIRQAEILAEQRAQAEKQLADVTLMAKLLAGINGFVENYGYSDGDLRTYAECAINRVIDQRFPNTISEVILQEGQWVGFSENNQVIEKYNNIALEVVGNYYNGNIRPCSSDYCWVELRRDGCWLKNAYSDSPYIKTWRYSA